MSVDTSRWWTRPDSVECFGTVLLLTTRFTDYCTTPSPTSPPNTTPNTPPSTPSSSPTHGGGKPSTDALPLVVTPTPTSDARRVTRDGGVGDGGRLWSELSACVRSMSFFLDCTHYFQPRHLALLDSALPYHFNDFRFRWSCLSLFNQFYCQ